MEIFCPKCQSKYEVDNQYSTMNLECPNCKTSFKVNDMSPIENIEDNINTFIEKMTLDDQDGSVLQKTYHKVEKLLTKNEKIEYIALQKKLLFNIAPDSIVLTNRRIIILNVGIFGTVNIWDVIWRDLMDAKLNIGILRASITLHTRKGSRFVGNLLKTPASRAYSILQEQEERIAEERRQREIEEKRAAAGGVVINTPQGCQGVNPSTPLGDSIAVMRQLKDMLDAGLITQGEYESKRQSIISRF